MSAGTFNALQALGSRLREENFERIGAVRALEDTVCDALSSLQADVDFASPKAADILALEELKEETFLTAKVHLDLYSSLLLWCAPHEKYLEERESFSSFDEVKVSSLQFSLVVQKVP